MCPFIRGGKAGLFGGAGVGKTVLIMEFMHSVATAPSRRIGFRGRGRAHPRSPRTLARNAVHRSDASDASCLRTNGRIARSAVSGRAFCSHLCGIPEGCASQRSPARHGQCLPFRPGGQRNFRAAWQDARSRWLSANAHDGNCGTRGTHSLNSARCRDVRASRLCPRRRHDGPCGERHSEPSRHDGDSFTLPGRQRDLSRRRCLAIKKQIHGPLLPGRSALQRRAGGARTHREVPRA